MMPAAAEIGAQQVVEIQSRLAEQGVSPPSLCSDRSARWIAATDCALTSPYCFDISLQLSR